METSDKIDEILTKEHKKFKQLKPRGCVCKVQMVKTYRNETGAGLKDAIAAVEAWANKHGKKF